MPDHIGLVPALVANGFDGKIYIPRHSKQIMRDMLYDGAYLAGRTAYCLSTNKKEYDALYTNHDVNMALNMVVELDDVRTNIDDNISIELFDSGHILLAKQALFYFKDNMNEKKLLYTSDLGDKSIKNSFANRLQHINHADIVISESTYADVDRKDIERDRKKDLSKLKNIIKHNKKIIIPAFSLSRSQNILIDLYDMYKDDTGFNKRVIVDSPLTQKVFNNYLKILEDTKQFDKYNKLSNAMEWYNVKFTRNVKESKSLIAKDMPQVIITSSGMLQGGRSVFWTKSIINRNDCAIVFSGYQGVDTLGYKIKNWDRMKIYIDDEIYDFKVEVDSLDSYSSHIQYNSLLKYLSNINSNEVYLHHGDHNNKVEFSKVLKQEYENKFKTTKVIPTRKDMTVEF
jgi:metallo-beta-lactamase family protein